MAATDGKFFLAKSSFTVLIHRAVSQKYCKISYHLSRDKKKNVACPLWATVHLRRDGVGERQAE